MTAREFGQWLAYRRIQPYGEEAADLRNAILCCVVRGLLGNRAKLEDFLLRSKDPEQVAREKAAAWQGWVSQTNAAFGGGGG
jgi:hypothetical protein